MLRITKSQSMVNSCGVSENNEVNQENNEVESPPNHASQMAYYQKFLEIRKKVISSKLEVSRKTEVHGSEKEEDKPREIEEPSLLEDNTFSCSTCSFTTDKERTIREHERAHKRNGNPIFRCVYCNQKYTRYALYLHIQNVHPGQRFQVPEKEEKYIEPNEPARRDSFKCSKCPFVATSRAFLDNHLKTRCCKEKLNNVSSGEISCPKCSYTTNRRDHIESHLMVHKRNPKLVRCCFCSFTSTVIAVKCHERKCSLRLQYKCKLCSYRCQYKGKMKTHRRSHGKNVPILPCPNNCNFQSTPAALKAHIMKSKCDITSAQRSSKSEVSAVDNKMNAKRFKCSKCPFACNLRIKLNLHIKKRHSSSVVQKNNSFKCPHCSLITNTSHNLHSHMRCHRRKTKTLKCGSCDFTSSVSALARHFAKSGHEPSNLELPAVTTAKTENTKNEVTKLKFGCPRCPFSTNLKLKLRLHLRSHYKEAGKRYKCSLCSVVTAGLSAHNQHTRSHKRLPTKTCNCGFKSTPIFFSLHKLECEEGEFKPTTPDAGKEKNLKFELKECSVTLEQSVIGTEEVPASELPLLHCPSCQFSTDIPLEMKIHSKKLHLKVFHCTHCSVVVTNSANFRKHMRVHKRKDPVKKCPYCNFKSVAKCLYRHLKEYEHQPDHQSKTKLFRCEKCSFASKHEKLLQTHYLVHERNQTRSTRSSLIDDTEAKRKRSLASCEQNSPATPKAPKSSEQHANNSKIVRKQKLFDCKLCSVTNLMAPSLTRHMQTHLNGCPIIQCKQCDFKSTKKRFMHHVAQSGHYVNKYWVAKRMQKLEAVSDENTHHTTPFNFRCPLCPFATNLRIKLNIHKRKQHSNDNENNKGIINNPEPGILKANSTTLGNNRKRKRSPKEFKYSCTICSYTTLLETYFNKHMDEHKTIFQCQYCGVKGLVDSFKNHSKSCAQVAVGRKSKSVYLKKVLLNCEKCSFTTYFPADLRDHEENGHKEEKVTKNIGEIKNFRCEYCSFTSYWQYLIDRHIQSHTILKLPIKQCSKCDFRSTPAALTAHTNKCIKGSSGTTNRKANT